VSFDDKAEWFDDHYRKTRGMVRLALLLERIEQTFPPPPARVLDVGGGTAIVSVPLAKLGYDVTLLEPSDGMLDVARRRIEGAGASVDVIQAGLEDVAELVSGPFDGICCHAVLLYLDEPERHLAALQEVARPGTVMSLLEKNRAGLSLRPGLQGNYVEAIRVLDDPVASGNLGISNRSRSPDEWGELLAAAGWHVDSWVGIRLFSDLAPDDLPVERFQELLTLEREAGRQPSYRSVARLIHISATAE
jgi:2-polyprenyl-3-methyl-5-hydroxy-6-metoxy-1,4-benzoquinol methylase